jgi:hypothetical protein
MILELKHEITLRNGDIIKSLSLDDAELIKTTLRQQFDFTEYQELKEVVGVRDVLLACWEFESKLRELWKYYEPESGLDFETIDKIRDMWIEKTEDCRWVME